MGSGLWNRFLDFFEKSMKQEATCLSFFPFLKATFGALSTKLLVNTA